MSVGLVVDPAWVELYHSIPRLGDDFGWDKFCRNMRALQQQWTDAEQNMSELVMPAQRLPFQTLTTLYSMQEQRIFARLLHDSPSLLSPARPVGLDKNLLRWQIVAARLAVERNYLTRGHVDQRYRHEWQTSKPMAHEAMDVLATELPRLRAALAEAERQPGSSSKDDGEHPALAAVRGALMAKPATRAMLRFYWQDAATRMDSPHDLTYRYSLPYERVRLAELAKRVLWRLAVQDEAHSWAQSVARRVLGDVERLEKMCFPQGV
jgi:hypothetical protein